ncbi:hypothetical protein [Helicovermis profundi]|uniref:SCP2 domain-containing protein n=1 Tax=Helicovermis profundi TaxID=3065157 RepID=A0AAU9ED68_9FIRM|nr:hypothetical protein HLPR_08930 [Clostridia bacterium S502]
MTVHFFYDYKDELIKSLSDHYSEDIKKKEVEKFKKHQIFEAEETIKAYFANLWKDIEPIVEASNGEIEIDFSEENVVLDFSIKKNFIKFSKKGNSIEIKIGRYIPEEDIVEAEIHGYIVPGEKRAIVKKLGKVHDGSTFEESLINYYLKLAFNELF